MAGNTLQLDVTILGRDYRVACAEDEQAELREAVALLDARMREIRDKGRTAGIDRIAVMAALNITHELIQRGEQSDKGSQDVNDRVRRLTARIDDTLSNYRQIEM
jgi:cell division protein ZapA